LELGPRGLRYPDQQADAPNAEITFWLADKQFAVVEHVTTPMNIFVTDERRAWMRLRDHLVVFDREPDFQRFHRDPSGSILRVLRIWVARPGSDSRHLWRYVGSIRRCECGGWVSNRELLRLFRRASVTARHVGERADAFRARLRGFLRDYFDQ
jgi:hypothetical protein